MISCENMLMDSAFIKKCDESYDKRLVDVAEKILNMSGFGGEPVKAVLLAGPSCSGKTTTAKKFTEVFGAAGRKAYIISIDDFFLDRDILLARSTDGTIDFDSPETINSDDLEKCVSKIFETTSSPVSIPVFDFISGTRVGETTIYPDPDEVSLYIFEGIQAFYPKVSKIFKDYSVASVFTNVFGSLEDGGMTFSGNTVRFFRRLVRDFRKRGADPEYTYRIWQGVRRNEEENIFPNAYKADFILDSMLGYDVAILKPFLTDYLCGRKFGVEFTQVAHKIISDIDGVRPVDFGLVSDSSLFREFI